MLVYGQERGVVHRRHRQVLMPVVVARIPGLQQRAVTGEPELPVVAKNGWRPLRRLIGPPDRVRNRVEQLVQHTGARVHGDAVVDRFRGTLKGDTPVKTSERRRRGVHVDRSREAFAAGEQIIDAE